MTTAQFDIHPDMAEVIAAKQAVPHSDDPEALRAAWNGYGARLARERPAGMKVRDTTIPRPASRGGDIPVRIYRPEGVELPSPCAVYLHGGAFIKGSLDSGDTVAWSVAEELIAADNEVVLRCARRMIHGFLRARFSGAAAAAEFSHPCRFLRTRISA